MFSGISYGYENDSLRVPIGVSSDRVKDAGQQYGLRLKGGVLDEEESSSFDKEFNKLIKNALKSGNAWSLFEDRKHQLEDEKDLKKYPSGSNFFLAIRKYAKELPKGFDIVIIESESGLPIDLILHPGHSRNQAYIASSTIKILEDIYDNLNTDYKAELVQVIIEGFKHEAKHIELWGHHKR